jgi:hypothetical protein
MQNMEFMTKVISYESVQQKWRGIKGLKALRCDGNYESAVIKPFWELVRGQKSIYWQEVTRIREKAPPNT